MFLGACLPACLLGSHTPSPPCPQLSADSYIPIYSRPALGSRADVFSVPVCPQPQHTHVLTRTYTPPPTPQLPGWSQITLRFPATREAVSPLPPPSSSFIHQTFPHLNTAWVLGLQVSSSSLTLHQIFCCSLWESDVRG